MVIRQLFLILILIIIRMFLYICELELVRICLLRTTNQANLQNTLFVGTEIR